MLACHDHVLEAKGITIIKTSLFYKLYLHSYLPKKKKKKITPYYEVKIKQTIVTGKSSKDHTATATISCNYTD